MAEELGFDSKAQTQENPERESRRWRLEIKLALKREKEWREKAKAIFAKYRGTNAKKNSFNILWANTEVLRPALYNSTPKPDVRRRFRQNDMLGKAVAEVAERSLSYCVDAYDLDNCLRNDVLDALLPGRACARVRYIPKFKEVPQDVQEPAPQSAQATTVQPAADDGGEKSRIKAGFFPAKKEAIPVEQGEAFEGNREEVEYEQALCDHVQWDDFIHGSGKTWDEVPWVGFRCKLTKDDLVEKFGKDVADQIKLGDVAEPEIENEQNKDISGVFKRAECWEIWDKESGKVFFVNESYRQGLIYPKTDGVAGTPPLKLKDFFPCPRPLMLVEDSGTLVPTPLYELYKEQADELDRLSGRINKIVNACRVRFVHDPTLTELKSLMDAGDNEGIPAEQARAWMANGGIEKAIWWMPIQQVAAVLKELYIARDSAKQVIYEITGLSDVVRGSSVGPAKTATEQQIKANSASLRLQRMQREVQRYVRDLIRLLAEVIGENFDPQTLAQMTGLQFPTAVQKQQGQLLLQAAQAAQQQGQQISQEAQQKVKEMQEAMSMPSWEDVMGVLRSDMQREYRVDVETDSTVAQSLQQDAEGLKEVIGGLVEFWNGVGPAVQSGALSIDAVKSISLVIVRRTRMGLEVEDAIENGIQQPKPQQDPKAQAAQAKLQHDQQVAAAKQQQEQAKQAHDQQMAQQEQAMEERRLQMEAHFERQRLESERRTAEQQAMLDAAFAKFKALLDAQTKVDVAQIGADAKAEAAAKQPETVQ